MTTTNNGEFQVEPPADLVLSNDARYFLNTAGKWAQFLSILGFIGTGFIVLIALFISTILAFAIRLNPMAPPDAANAMSGISGVITVVYLGIAALYFFMSYYLNRFAVYIKKSVLFGSSADATKAFQNLKSHFKLIGIVAIIVISIYILALVVVIIAAVAGAFATHAPGY